MWDFRSRRNKGCRIHNCLRTPVSSPSSCCFHYHRRPSLIPPFQKQWSAAVWGLLLLSPACTLPSCTTRSKIVATFCLWFKWTHACFGVSRRCNTSQGSLEYLWETWSSLCYILFHLFFQGAKSYLRIWKFGTFRYLQNSIIYWHKLLRVGWSFFTIFLYFLLAFYVLSI